MKKLLLLIAVILCQFYLNAQKTLPPASTRVNYDKNSFAYFIQHFPRKIGVNYYDGRVKNPRGISLNIDVTKNQQCADAIIRLHAEWLYHAKRYNDIHYNFTNGFNAEYSRWACGERIQVNGNNVKWVGQKGEPDYSYETFRKYLEMVFLYAGTASLDKELVPVDRDHIEVGDILIIGGYPGHAAIVLDKYKTKDGLYITCAQSWMPAQDIELVAPAVCNPVDPTIGYCDYFYPNFLNLGDWERFIFHGGYILNVSGYHFKKDNIKQFKIH